MELMEEGPARADPACMMVQVSAHAQIISKPTRQAS